MDQSHQSANWRKITKSRQGRCDALSLTSAATEVQSQANPSFV